jgi:peptidoglycan/LPS O-acetylase OafA/YrhL
VLLVVLDHAGVPFLRGGYVGVDVFFVLSGFLITAILLGLAERRGSVSLVDFYARRARRILPAAALTLLATDVAAHLLLNFVRAREVASDSVWASAFAANVHFARDGTDYFAQGQPPSPLLHFWTLSVEEQFYLVWPALLAVVLLRTVRRGRLLLLIVAIGIGSLAWSIESTTASGSDAYFSTFARAWELALGAALAIALPHLPSLPPRLRRGLGWAGLLAVVAAAVWYSSATRFPGYAALLPAAGAAVLIVAGAGAETPRLSAGRLLSTAPMRYVGDRSYALYLWHWPVLTIAVLRAGHELTTGVKLLLVLAAFALSVVSYRLVENPMRRARLPAGVSGLLWPASAATVLVAALLTMHSSSATAARIDLASASFRVHPLIDQTTAGQAHGSGGKPLPAVAAAVRAAEQAAPLPSPLVPSIAGLHQDFYFFPDGCTPTGHATASKICTLGQTNSPKTIAVIGDSHAEMWMPAILAMAQQDAWAVVPFVKAGCIPRTWTSRGECGTWYRWAVRHAQQLRPTATLIMGSRAGTHDPLQGVKPVVALSTAMRPYSESVIVVSDAPNQTRDPTDCLLAPGATMQTCTTRSKPTQLQAEAALAARTRKSTGFINVLPWLCAHPTPSTSSYLCPMVVNHTITTIDREGHLSKTYVLELAPSFRAAFRRQLFR